MSIATLSRRGVGLIVALLLAAFATAAWVSYVRSIERRAVRAQSSIEVYVAAETIPAGTTAEAADAKKWFVKEPVPRRLVAEGAITKLSTLRGTVAGTTIVKGEQIVKSRFLSPELAGRVLQIPAGMHAIAVEVAAPPGVAGFVQPRDRVSVIANVDVEVGGKNEAVVKFLLQDVVVLAVGTRTQAAPPPSGSREASRKRDAEQPSDKLLLTLAVTPWQAEQLAFAVTEGTVYFTLLSESTRSTGTPGRTAESLFR